MNIKTDPAKQFSKKLARWTSVFWFLYMAWLSVLMLLAPDVALYAVYMAIIATVVMTINIFQYTSNSKFEKALLTLLDRTSLELKFGNSSLKMDEKSDGDQKEGESDG